MKTRARARLGAWLAGVWTGLMGGVGFIAAPLLFAGLPAADAGRLAARLFSLEASVAVCIGALLTILTLQQGRDRAEQGRGSRFAPELGLALAALFCVVVGYYGVQPMMDQARAGAAALSFGTLHGIATAFFVLRLAIAAVLAWLLAQPAA